ncbi:hypothetical protein Tco_0638887, partial [Tanacetum coccineum]
SGDDTRWRDDECSTITDDGTGSTKSGKERFKEFANYSGVVGGERLCFNTF